MLKVLIYLLLCIVMNNVIQKSQFEFFKKPCGFFPPQSEMGEKTRGGNQRLELSHNNHFLQ